MIIGNREALNVIINMARIGVLPSLQFSCFKNKWCATVGTPSKTNLKPTNGMIYNGRRDPNLDRFFLSPTHYALTLYATLIETGRLEESSLDQFNVDGSSLEMIGS